MTNETRGRKPNKEKGKEVKVSKGVYAYPKQFKRIEKRFGSLGKFFTHCLTQNQI